MKEKSKKSGNGIRTLIAMLVGAGAAAITNSVLVCRAKANEDDSDEDDSDEDDSESDLDETTEEKETEEEKEEA